MKKVKTVIAVLLVLAAAIAVLAVLNRPANIVDSGMLLITYGETGIEFSTDDLKALPYVEVEKEIVSSSFANDHGVFRGVPVRSVLEKAGAATDGAKQCIVHSEDGFIAAFPMAEITESDNIFLAYSKDGESLGSKDNGGTGPLRIVVTDDEFGNRCAKYVCELEIK